MVRDGRVEEKRSRVLAEHEEKAEGREKTGGTCRRNFICNTRNLLTWFQSKLLHVYLNITDQDRSVQQMTLS